MRRWELYNDYYHEVIAFENTTIPCGGYCLPIIPPPIGVHQWYNATNKYVSCHSAMKLHIDVKQPGNFVCDDGFFLDSDQVCDGIPVCRNQEDERKNNCQIIIPQFYNPVTPPMNFINGSNGIEFLETNLTVNLTVIEILHVDEADSNFEIFFKLRLSWFDKALKYEFLKRDESRNNVKNNYNSTIWTPQIAFHHIKEEMILETGVNVIRGTPKLTNQMLQKPNILSKDIDIIEIYEGSASPLVFLHESRTKFTCSFKNIDSYPFKDETCFFNFYLIGPANNLMNFSLNPIEYSGPENFGPYLLKEWKMEKLYQMAMKEMF